MNQDDVNERGQPTRLPIPDPTVLTTEALRRDIGALRELLEERIVANQQLTLQMFAERELRYEQRFVAQENANITALTAAKEAVQKAEIATEKRFDAVNEFREQLSDQAATFMPRQEYQVQHDSLIERVSAGDKALSDRLDVNSKALSDRIDTNAKGLADAVQALQLARASGEGEKAGGREIQQQARLSRGDIYAAAGFLAIVIGIVSAVLALR